MIYNQPSDKRATNSGRKKPKTIEEMAERDTKQFLKDMEMLAGVSAQTPMTLEEIGAVLGCTRERVRQIEKNALRKLKFSLMRKGVLAGSDLIDTPYDSSDKFTKD